MNEFIKNGGSACRNRYLKNMVVYGILITGAVIVMYPFLFMLMNSIKTGTEILNNPLGLPTFFNFKGYVEVFRSLNMGRLFFNSIFISGTTTFLNVLFACTVAYGLVKSDLPHSDKILDVILASMMIPGIILLIPTYLMVYQWGWINTYRSLIIPGCISAYNIFLMVQFMKGIDDSYLEAARIDGASEIQILFRIIMPMSKPAIATIAILTFMGSWNDFMGPLLYLRGDSRMTVQLAIYRFQSAIPGKDIEQLWAAYALVTVPIVFVYLFLQKSFIRAFTGIGLK